MKAARAAGAVVSFDLNFREKLWRVSGGADQAVEVMNRIVENVDVLVGNEEDLQKGLGLRGPEVQRKSKLDPSAFFAMSDMSFPIWARQSAEGSRMALPGESS